MTQPEQPKKRSILDIAKERKANRPATPPTAPAPSKAQAPPKAAEPKPSIKGDGGPEKLGNTGEA